MTVFRTREDRVELEVAGLDETRLRWNAEAYHSLLCEWIGASGQVQAASAGMAKQRDCASDGGGCCRAFEWQRPVTVDHLLPFYRLVGQSASAILPAVPSSSDIHNLRWSLYPRNSWEASRS